MKRVGCGLFSSHRNDIGNIVMTIYTDGLEMGPPITIQEIQAANAAHDRAVMVESLLVGIAIIVLVGLWLVLPRLWRRARVHLAAPLRLPDPPSGVARGTNG